MLKDRYNGQFLLARMIDVSVCGGGTGWRYKYAAAIVKKAGSI